MSAPALGKITDTVCFKVDERTFIDLNRHCVRVDMKVSEFIRDLVRRELYGMLADQEGAGEQTK